MPISINEIFVGIDGEVNRFGQGGLTTFIRFNGCNLRCSYCDTTRAQKISDDTITIEDILKQIKTQKVTITGGEPLCQMYEFKELLRRLLNPFGNCYKEFGDCYKVSIETNGSIEIPFDEFAYAGPNIGWVIDYKFEYAKDMIFSNFYDAGHNDWIKFVINSKKDYARAVRGADQFHLNSAANIAFGFTNRINPQWLVDRMVEDNLYFVTLNCQIHKYLKLK